MPSPKKGPPVRPGLVGPGAGAVGVVVGGCCLGGVVDVGGVGLGVVLGT